MKRTPRVTVSVTDEKVIKIYAVNRQSDIRTEITDMYWFEENYVHSLTGNDAWRFEIEVKSK